MRPALCHGGLAEEIALHRGLYGPVDSIAAQVAALQAAGMIEVSGALVRLRLPEEPEPRRARPLAAVSDDALAYVQSILATALGGTASPARSQSLDAQRRRLPLRPHRDDLDPAALDSLIKLSLGKGPGSKPGARRKDESEADYRTRCDQCAKGSVAPGKPWPISPPGGAISACCRCRPRSWQPTGLLRDFQKSAWEFESRGR